MDELEKFKQENDLTDLLMRNKDILLRLNKEPFIDKETKETIQSSLETIDKLLNYDKKYIKTIK